MRRFEVFNFPTFDFTIEQTLDVLKLFCFIGANQGNCNTADTGTTGTAYAMYIIFRHIWQVKIPGGSFDMGTDSTDYARLSRSRQVHRVSVPTFYMGKYEVTQAQWRAVMGFDPSGFTGAQATKAKPLSSAAAVCRSTTSA